MNSKNWKSWSLAALLTVVVAYAIYTFAAPDRQATTETVSTPSAPLRKTRGRVAPAGVEPVHLDLLEAESGSYDSKRNLFMYKEPPVPPPPPPTPPPPPPPDQDKDGIPDFRDNCVAVANPDQRDVDQDGVGSVCETEAEVPPPPPPPQPPAFTYKFIGTFGRTQNPIATFARDGEILNARVGDVIEGKFILRRIGIESAEIGFVGFPNDRTQRVPLGQ